MGLIRPRVLTGSDLGTVATVLEPRAPAVPVQDVSPYSTARGSPLLILPAVRCAVFPVDAHTDAGAKAGSLKTDSLWVMKRFLPRADPEGLV